MNTTQQLPPLPNFEHINVSEEWCFKNVRSVEQWTHGYHRYPAKFLPNLVQKLIEEYTETDDIVADLFAGCGTTLVEAKIHGRKSIGVDINPVAELITRAKIQPLNPQPLQKRFDGLIKSFDGFSPKDFKRLKVHSKIDYWFTQDNKLKIAFLYDEILKIRNRSTRDFFLVSLSHILKNTSKWLQSSTKPQIDRDKTPADPFVMFKQHTKKMLKKNFEFYNQLKQSELLSTKCNIRLEDARRTSIRSNSVSAIITSPPYVTSYEYADIHQLTGYWYEYISDLSSFRKNFIGTFYSSNQDLQSKCLFAQDMINELQLKNSRYAKEVANYFNDMQSVAVEMHRILKVGGHACIVIGNTTFKGVKIQSAEVFASILEYLRFENIETIKRSIPHKLIPTIRDENSGRFSKLDDIHSKLVYPEEYIIIAKKL